jgi:hypothetical protein
MTGFAGVLRRSGMEATHEGGEKARIVIKS